MAFLLKTDGSIEQVHPDAADGCFTLQQLQQFVGGYIEAVYTHTGDIMLVNENGKLDGLPYNEQATERYMYGTHDPVVGNVLICTRREMENDEDEEL